MGKFSTISVEERPLARDVQSVVQRGIFQTLSLGALLANSSSASTSIPVVYLRGCLFLLGSGSGSPWFVMGLPTAMGGYDSIWVVIDLLTESTH
ncbi:hypothetical protein MTR67_043235 [Solanum verrucosum]|uniref:Uncharacterized protein n=1 Tax=Solanum verrucosum TaxID=315347 RepID=A0AAF0ZUH7_SOLVR|nr:hypothetical protein MTR67_043235 [Solanum verrucosum]